MGNRWSNLSKKCRQKRYRQSKDSKKKSVQILATETRIRTPKPYKILSSSKELGTIDLLET